MPRSRLTVVGVARRLILSNSTEILEFRQNIFGRYMYSRLLSFKLVILLLAAAICEGACCTDVETSLLISVRTEHSATGRHRSCVLVGRIPTEKDVQFETANSMDTADQHYKKHPLPSTIFFFLQNIDRPTDICDSSPQRPSSVKSLTFEIENHYPRERR